MQETGKTGSSDSLRVPPRALRSSTGCFTCRGRRVKCDETKPRCKNCDRKDRVCRYYRSESTGPTSPSREKSHVVAPDTSPLTSKAALAIARFALAPSVQSETAFPSPQAHEEVQLPLAAYHSTPSVGFAESIGLPPSLLTLSSVLRGADSQLVGNHLAVFAHAQQPRLHNHDDSAFTTSPAPLHVEHQIELTNAELPLFRNYVDNVSHWIDSFSYDRPFHQTIPVLALKCPALLHACLALGSKQLDLVCDNRKSLPDPERTVGYYRLALSAISALLLRNQSPHSDEVLAACIILSTYEMIDVVGDSLDSHLPGVASLLQERQINGDASGIQGACYWTWYRHEIWAAIRSGNCFSVDEKLWEPEHVESFQDMTPHQVANRVIFLFGQCIRICNKRNVLGKVSAETEDASEADFSRLDACLDNWKAMVPTHMNHFHVSQDRESLVDGKLYYLYPQSSIANQVYHASKILLSIHQTRRPPDEPGLTHCSFLTLSRRIENHRWNVFWTSNTGTQAPWGLISSQCLYIAGLVTEGVVERQMTLDLIDQVQKHTGRRTSHLSEDLRRLWRGGNESSVFRQV